MATFAVNYVYSTDIAGLDSHRGEHRAYLGALCEAGTVIVAGPLDVTWGGLIVFSAPDAAAVGATLDADPFWREGLIVERTVHEWNPVIGSLG